MGFKGRAFLLPGLLCLSCEGKDLGVHGALFEIKEQDLMEAIQSKLRALEGSGKLERHQKTLQARVSRSIERPHPIAGIGKATAYRSRDFDPSIIIGDDIEDHKGNLIAKKGSRINPLDHRSFGKPLLLIDGDDEAQVAWALAEAGRIVLIQGAPLLLRKRHGRPFFFDQGGVLTKKFGITAVPARVSRKGTLLMIEEVNPKEKSSRP